MGYKKNNKNRADLINRHKKMIRYTVIVSGFLFSFCTLFSGCGNKAQAGDLGVESTPSPSLQPESEKRSDEISYITPIPSQYVEYPGDYQDGEKVLRSVPFTVSDEILNRLSYKPEESPQIYARYQGSLNVAGSGGLRYIIDFIQLEDFDKFPSEFPIILNIKIYDQYNDQAEGLPQTIRIPVEGYCLNAPQGVVITDLNGDENDDFIVDLGVSTTGRSTFSLFFVYDKEKNQYKLLDGFTDATFYEDEMRIYEYYRSNIVIEKNKYSVEGTHLVLQETLLGETSIYGTQQFAYTEKKLINGKMTTVKQYVPEDQIDLERWHFADWQHRVK